jgi:hypothetical protein
MVPEAKVWCPDIACMREAFSRVRAVGSDSPLSTAAGRPTIATQLRGHCGAAELIARFYSVASWWLMTSPHETHSQAADSRGVVDLACQKVLDTQRGERQASGGEGRIRGCSTRRLIGKLSWRDTRGAHRLMVLIVLAMGLSYFFFGERVPAGGGLGWDGVTYAGMVRNLGVMLHHGLLSVYYAQRILPSAIVRGMLLVSGAQLSDANIIRAFELFNLALLVGGCLIWRRLADHFSISLGGRWIGFCGLFLSFNCAKAIFYLPANTDVAALFIGLLLLLCYVEKRPVALLVTAIMGAFDWQIASLCGAILLLFMEVGTTTEAIVPSPVWDSCRFARIARFAWLAVLGVSLAGFGTVAGLATLVGTHRSQGLHITGLEKVLTALPSLAGAALALVMLAGSLLLVSVAVGNLRMIRFRVVVLALVAVMVPWLLVRAIGNPTLANAGSPTGVFLGIVLPPGGKFLLPLVGLTAFWGPMVLLVLVNWRKFCLEARRLGVGFMAVVGMTLVLGLTTEPRFVTLGWPFLVLGGVLAMERTTTAPSFKYVWAALTIVFAQFWLKMNLAPWSPGIYDDLGAFPKQVLFMHYGLWMGWWAYLGQFAVVALCLGWLRRALRPGRQTEGLS